MFLIFRRRSVPEAPPLERCEKRVYQFSVFLLLVSLLRGLAFPHPWAATHLALNYREGFIKRGLLGALLNLIGIRGSYIVSVLIAAVVLGAALVFICRWFRRIIRVSRGGHLVFVPPIFASSLAIPYLGNTLGYLDQLGVLAVLVSFEIKRFWVRVAVSIGLLGILILIHEASFPLFAPILAGSLLVERGMGLNSRAAGAALVFFTAAPLTYFMANATISQDAAIRLYS